MKCANCNAERLESQVAHYACKECGESLAHCFTCDHDNKAYATVDAFRREHVCTDELAMRRLKAEHEAVKP